MAQKILMWLFTNYGQAIIGSVITLVCIWTGKKWLWKGKDGTPAEQADYKARMEKAQEIANFADSITDELVVAMPNNPAIKWFDWGVDKIIQAWGLNATVASRALNAALARKGVTIPAPIIALRLMPDEVKKPDEVEPSAQPETTT